MTWCCAARNCRVRRSSTLLRRERPGSSASRRSRSAPPGPCMPWPTRSAVTPRAVWRRRKHLAAELDSHAATLGLDETTARQVTSYALTALLGRLAATTDDTQTVRVLAAAELSRDNAFYYAHLDSAERLTLALSQVNWQVLDDFASAGDTAEGDTEASLITSALRQAARRDEHEMALAAPLRKAAEDAITLLRERAQEPVPARVDPVPVRSPRSLFRCRPVVEPRPGSGPTPRRPPGRPVSASGRGTFPRSSSGSARRRTSTRTRSSRSPGGSWSGDGARRQPVGRRARTAPRPCQPRHQPEEHSAAAARRARVARRAGGQLRGQGQAGLGHGRPVRHRSRRPRRARRGPPGRAVPGHPHQLRGTRSRGLRARHRDAAGDQAGRQLGPGEGRLRRAQPRPGAHQERPGDEEGQQLDRRGAA